jgi:cell division septum initiation protein DivIVA
MSLVENAPGKEEPGGRGPKMDVLKLLDELEEHVEGSKQVMNKAIWVDLDEFFARTNKIRASLPEEIKRATRIAKEGQRILDDVKEEARRLLEESRAEADRTVATARAEAERLVESSEIKRVATERAAEIIAVAEQRADEIRRGARSYAQEVLGNLESSVNKVLASIHKGQEQLQSEA